MYPQYKWKLESTKYGDMHTKNINKKITIGALMLQYGLSTSQMIVIWGKK